MSAPTACVPTPKPTEIFRTPVRPQVRCDCGRAVFDGQAVRARVVLVDARGDSVAKCQCKRWVALPLRYVAVDV